MKDAFLTTLRDKNSSQKTFRNAAQKLGSIIASEAALKIKQQIKTVETAHCSTVGYEVAKKVCLVAILRSGMTLLPSFLYYFEDASIGILGIRRDENTYKPMLYYENIPSLDKDTLVIILDPMLATGGTLCLAIDKLTQKGAKPSEIIIHSIIAAPEGIKQIHEKYKEVIINTVAIDEKLNTKKYIVPGLGDYGDRFFGT